MSPSKDSIPKFDRSGLHIKPLSAREHDLDRGAIRPLRPVESPLVEKMVPVAERLISARKENRAKVMMMGAHVIRAGVQHYLNDLMDRGYLDCLAMNGAGIIHDYEFALIGATTESVARYIKTGEFGFWRETGELNEMISNAFKEDRDIGLGAAIGHEMEKRNCPHKDISLLVQAARKGVDVTIHVAIGQDIIHQHPNCDGAATGGLSYNDFLKFAAWIEKLEGGVVMNFGSAIMAPEVYLKALSMARNKAGQQGKCIRDFTTLVCDLHSLPEDFTSEAPRDSAAYYFRPWKTMLVRTVADGGRSFYVRGNHAETVPALWQAIGQLEN